MIGPVARALPACVLIVGLVMARQAQAAPPSPIAQSRLELRRAATSETSASERVARLLLLAELEDRAGNGDLAGAAAAQAVDGAGVSATIAALMPGANPSVAATQLRETVRAVVRIGARLRDSQLVLRALEWAPEEIPANTSSLRNALLGGGYPSLALKSQLRRIEGGEPPWRAFLAGRDDDAPMPPDDVLVGLGDVGLTLLERRLDAALETGDIATAGTIAAHIRGADAHHLRARVLHHLLDDLKAGRVSLTPVTVKEAVAVDAGTSTMAFRLKILAGAYPAAVGVALAAARAFADAHLHADAGREATQSLSPQATAEHRATAQQIVAVAALGAGRVDEYRRWAAASGAERSWWWIRSVLDRASVGPAATALRGLRQVALRGLFRDPLSPANAQLQVRWAHEAAMFFDDPVLHKRGMAVLEQSDAHVAALIQTCVRVALPRDECETRWSDDSALSDDEDGGGQIEDLPRALERLGEVKASALSNLARLPFEKLRRIKGWFGRLSPDRYAATPGHVELSIALALADGDRKRAAEVFGEASAVLPTSRRVELALVLKEVGSRRAAKSEALTLDVLPPAANHHFQPNEEQDAAAGDVEDEEEEDDEAGRQSLVGRLSRSLIRPVEALKVLRPIWRRFDGLAGVELAGYTALSAYRSGNQVLGRRAQERVAALAPASALAARLALEYPVKANPPGDALLLAARFWSMAPESTVAAELFARRWVATMTVPPTAESRAWIARAAQGGRSEEWSRLQRAIDGGLAQTPADLAAVLASERDRSLALRFSPDLEAWSHPVTRWIERRFETLPPAQLPAFASKVSEYLARGSAGQRPAELVFWSNLLAGRTDQALREAAAPRATGVSPLTLSVGRRKLFGALSKLHDLPDVGFRQDLFRLFRQGATETANDLPEKLFLRAAASQSPGQAQLRRLACLGAVHLNRTRQGVVYCWAAWRGGDRSEGVALALAARLADDANATRSEGVDGELFFKDAFAAFGSQAHAKLWECRGVWLAHLRRYKDASEAFRAAWTAGEPVNGSGLEEQTFGWVQHQPQLARLVRAVSHEASSERHLGVAVIAMLGGDLEVAAAHLDAAAMNDSGPPRSEAMENFDETSALLRDVIELAGSDVREKRVDRAGLAELMLGLFSDKLQPVLLSLGPRYPRSDAVKVLALEDKLMRTRAIPETELGELIKRFPKNFVVLRLTLLNHLVSQRLNEAQVALTKMRGLWPDDPRLSAAAEMLGGAGKAAAMPEWAAKASAFSAALSRSDAHALVTPSLERAQEPDEQLDGFLPPGFVKQLGDGLQLRGDGVVFIARRVPRATHCSPALCMEEVAVGMRSKGAEAVWSREIELPMGSGHEGLFKTQYGLAIVSAVPMGAHVFLLIASGGADMLGSALPAYRLFRETLRTNDVALGRARSALITRALWAVASDAAARSRLEMAQAKSKGCPIRHDARTGGGESMGSLLAELFLLTPQPELRARLLSCTRPDGPHAKMLGVAAILDAGVEAADFGRKAVQRHASFVVGMIRDGSDLDQERPPASSGPEDRPRGLLQILEALPSQRRQEMAAAWVAGGEPRLRALGLVAGLAIPGTMPDARIEEILKNGALADTIPLVSALSGWLPDPLLAGVRARLDAMPLAPNRGQARLILQLALPLARRLEPDDLSRLERIRPAVVVAGDSAEASNAGTVLGAIDAHRIAVRPASENRLTAAERTTARAVLARWRGEIRPGDRIPGHGAELTRPLASRLPDEGWHYFRINHPGAVAAALTDLAGRVARGGARTTAAELFLSHVASKSGADSVGRSGMNVEEPFECAVSNGGAWACTGLARDMIGVRDGLARSGMATTGLSLPWLIGSAGMMSQALSLYLPLFLPLSLPEASPAVASSGSGLLISERVDRVVQIGSFRLQHRFELGFWQDHRLEVTESVWLPAGKRLWAFSDESTARFWLAAPFGKGAAPQSGRSAAAVSGLWRSGDGDKDPAQPFEVTLTSEGLRVETQSAVASGEAVPGDLGAFLPEGAIQRVVSANMSGEPVSRFVPSLAGLTPKRVLPQWLWTASPAAAFGWYRDPDNAVGAWITVVPWTPATEAAWSQRQLPAPSAEQTRQAQGLTFRRRDDRLLVSSNQVLMNSALAQPAPRMSRSAARMLEASVEPNRLADVLRPVAADSRSDRMLGVFDGMATMIGGVRTVSRVVGERHVTETAIQLKTNREPSGGAVVDEWLRSGRIKNSVRLPRAIDSDDGARPLVFILRSDRPDDVKLAFAQTERVTLTPRPSGTFELRVVPRPAASVPKPLMPEERRLYVANDKSPAVAPIRLAAQEIAGSIKLSSERATAVLDWVHRNLTYEVTPFHVDDATLLERRRGDCTEYAQLAVAMLRSLDVPARVRSGLMASGHTLVGHAWAEFHDGSAWREFDPTAGRSSVDSTYIHASVIDLISSFSNGRVEITSVE